MCLGIPGQILSIDDSTLLRMAKVDFGGISKSVSLVYTPEAVVSNYVIVHVGFAISIINESEAQKLLATLDELMERDNEISG